MRTYTGPLQDFASRRGYTIPTRRQMANAIQVVRQVDRNKAREFRDWQIWLGMYPVRLRQKRFSHWVDDSGQSWLRDRKLGKDASVRAVMGPDFATDFISTETANGRALRANKDSLAWIRVPQSEADTDEGFDLKCVYGLID